MIKLDSWYIKIGIYIYMCNRGYKMVYGEWMDFGGTLGGFIGA